MEQDIKLTLEHFPFLSLVRYNDQEYIGIIGNSDNQITSMYIYNTVLTEKEKVLFLNVGDKWWWETNRILPINISMRLEWAPFKIYLKSFISKELDIISGPKTSLDKIMEKRIKRKSITLVKKMF